MLSNLISILLMAGFIYALMVNFRRGNYAYSFVMYVGAVIFYANFYHRLAQAFWVMLLMILLSSSLAILFVYRAIECQDNRHHYWGAVALSALTLVLALLFSLVL